MSRNVRALKVLVIALGVLLVGGTAAFVRMVLHRAEHRAREARSGSRGGIGRPAATVAASTKL